MTKENNTVLETLLNHKSIRSYREEVPADEIIKTIVRDFVLFEDKYPRFDKEQLERAMRVMDEGYLKQDYYKNLDAKIALKDKREEKYSYENYSWTEHISRKWGQWFEKPDKIREQLKKCGFVIFDE